MSNNMTCFINRYTNRKILVLEYIHAPNISCVVVSITVCSGDEIHNIVHNTG